LEFGRGEKMRGRNMWGFQQEVTEFSHPFLAATREFVSSPCSEGHVHTAPPFYVEPTWRMSPRKRLNRAYSTCLTWNYLNKRRTYIQSDQFTLIERGLTLWGATNQAGGVGVA
jgi:hypothetical protein